MLVPIIAKDKTEEYFPKNTPEKRMKYYGHPEHVRNYGLDYKERLKECGWNVNIIHSVNILSAENIELMGITEAAGEIYLCTK